MRKPRSDKKLEALTPDQRDKLFEIVTRPGISLAKAVALCRAEFSISVGIRAMSVFRDEEIRRREIERFKLAATHADAIVESAADQLPVLTKALKARLVESAFQMHVAGVPAKEIKSLISIVGSIDRGDLESRRLQLEMDKFRESLKGQIERALDALFAEIKGNAKAEAAFAQLRQCVDVSTERKAA